jgi:hypothetical protein
VIGLSLWCASSQHGWDPARWTASSDISATTRLALASTLIKTSLPHLAAKAAFSR